MADLGKENEVSGVFGGIDFGNETTVNNDTIRNAGSGLPVKTGFWNKVKSFWLKEIDWNEEVKVELTPYQQKVENELNGFLHQEVTWEKVHDFLFQEIAIEK